MTRIIKLLPAGAKGAGAKGNVGARQQELYNKMCMYLWHFYPLPDRLLVRGFGVESGPEPSRALLVHLGSGGDAVDGHKEEFLGLDLAEQVLDIVEYSDEHLVLAH